MPHYVIQLDNSADPDADAFVIYSTVVDNTITEEMSATEMLQWLQDNDYGSWLTPYDPEEMIRNYGDFGDDDYYRRTARYFYWHDTGFCFGKLSDEYFVLPMELWRFE